MNAILFFSAAFLGGVFSIAAAAMESAASVLPRPKALYALCGQPGKRAVGRSNNRAIGQPGQTYAARADLCSLCNPRGLYSRRNIRKKHPPKKEGERLPLSADVLLYMTSCIPEIMPCSSGACPTSWRGGCRRSGKSEPAQSAELRPAASQGTCTGSSRS